MQVIKELTGGAGADYCFECVGLSAVSAEAFKSSRKGWGKTIVLGVDGHMAPISIPPSEIMRGRSVVGSLLGGIKPKDDIPMLAQKYLDKVTGSTNLIRELGVCKFGVTRSADSFFEKQELELDAFITHQMGFDEINRAFELLTQGKSLRCILWMDGARQSNGA
ncbi:hypothetical protein EJB05_11163 [Eragrostis curvula]|uniref:Alcohol dehydrogenase-like C-terminal domain-containing protein n=1 Tax=Eragrostis curvula TaxID=38414 RepID=A0A5J9VNS9_9POAL|nr:hypothetical protein EJB05_11163 [Eragrostis curvula]